MGRADRMIGVIGPRDSTELALSVAHEEGLDGSVVARTYDSVEEAPALARELDAVCQVLLFTGRIPYALSNQATQLRAALQFVPHAGADLYAAIVRLLREFKGELPKVSLDTIEPQVVEEAYEDLGLEPSQYVLPLEVGNADSVRRSDEIVSFHLAAYRSGVVQGCLSCLGSVHRDLRAAGVPVWRISHTKSVMREALRQAHLAARLAITEATQPTVVLVKMPGMRARSAGPASANEAQDRRLKARDVMLRFAEDLHGRLADFDEATFVVYTNRGAVEVAISRLITGHSSPLDLRPLPFDVGVGVGLGSTVSGAEANARGALVMSEQHGDVHVAFADGQVLRASRERPATTYQLRETDETARRLAQQLGLGPLTLTRLTRALRQVDTSAVTAAELAGAYGVEARSARRLMKSLQRAGVATRVGRQGGSRAGRPQTVYRVHLDRLVGPEEP